MCIYGAIKVQVNRGGGLHGSAASKFCGSYVASENAQHYTIPKPKPRELRLSSSFLFAENTSLRDLQISDCRLNAHRCD